MISKDVLLSCGAEIKTYKKGEFLFYKGNKASYYYQIVSGEIKMNNFGENGKEFIQGIFKKGDSFGEPPLFIDRPYPANAEVIKEAQVFVLSKKDFLSLIQKQKAEIEVLKIFAKRLYYKSIIAVEMSSETAGHRILSLLDYFKTYTPKDSSKNNLFKFNFTRQEIANLTGLRVETVIRAIKNLENKGCIKIIDRKIHR